MMNRRNLLLWVLVFGLIVFAVQYLFSSFTGPTVKDYSTLLDDITNERVQSTAISSTRITATLQNGESYEAIRPPVSDLRLIDDLLAHNVKIIGIEPQSPNILLQLLFSLLPVLLIVGVMFFLYRQQAGAKGGGPFSFGQSKAKKLMEGQVNTTFKDVAGADLAKDELVEIVDFLKNPSKYHKIGARIPRGVLLYGSPGTGKTLLARAVAGEAKVPFFFISGSDFVEMFVGVGASRVRDMFTQARKNSPCIIFIDEIDAVGRHRGAGHGGGNDEREQTLNQLLVEMDGFDDKSGVIVIAATNRPDVLDKALLRPGRFDRQITVELPDLKGREAILNVHLKKVQTEGETDVKNLAKGTIGLAGADLANIINEAALLAARKNQEKVSNQFLDEAKDKVMMGPERSKDFMDDKEKKLTAYHEAGHAIIGFLSPEHDEVYKITILPRGRALGVTMFLPEKDARSHTLTYLKSHLATAYGGRIAEALIFGEDQVTTGASQDIKQATDLATRMVTEWGYSKEVGPLNYNDNQQHAHMVAGFSDSVPPSLSDDMRQKIDEEIKTIIMEAYNKAHEILSTNMDKLHALAQALLAQESVSLSELKMIMSGNKLEIKNDQRKSQDEDEASNATEAKSEPKLDVDEAQQSESDADEDIPKKAPEDDPKEEKDLKE